MKNQIKLGIQKSRSSYWKLLPYIYEYWPTIVKALTCTLVFTIFWPILAWLMGEMAGYIGKGDVRAIIQLAGLAAIIFMIKGAVQYGQDTLMAKAALTIALEIA